MRVKYRGHKKRMPIWLPLGVKSRSAVEQELWADPYAELSLEDAATLCARDPHNWEIADEPLNVGPIEPVGEPDESWNEPTVEVTLPAESEPAPVRRKPGRKPRS